MHNIIKTEYPVTWTLKKITDDVRDTVRSNGDHYGTERLRVPTDKVFDTYDEAEDYIDKVDEHDYDGIAVKFLDYSKVEETKKGKEYRAKIAETLRKRKEYEKAHSIHTLSAVYAGCPKCGSKLKRDLINGEFCPLCRADLRSASTLDRLAAFDAKTKELNRKVIEEKKKQKAKAETKWLVKYEYHS